MATFSGRKRTLRGPVRERRSFCSSPYARSLRCEHLEDRRLLAQITVTTDQDIVDLDDGATSLREAIFAANIASGADEIVFDFGHDGPAKILLTEGELKITDALTISGPGAELLVIDNSPQRGPIFSVDDRSSNTVAQVSMSGMTLSGSKNSAIRAVEDLTIEDMILRGNRGASGAGVLMGIDGAQTQNIKLTVRNSQFEDNHTISATGLSSGGAIAFLGRFGELTIENTSFVGNSGMNGGGVSVAGFSNLVKITDSDFVDNDAVRGGGIFIADDNSKIATLTRVEVRDNTGALAGGGIYVAGKPITILDSEITGNRTTNSSGQLGGGGIFKQGNDTFIVRNSRFSDNHSFFDGGGIALVGSGLELADSVVERNTAAKSGGGMSLISVANVDITRSTISGNSAGASGGGLYSRGPSNSNLRLFDSTVSGNAAAGSGGGLSVSSGTFLLQNSTVSGNEAGSDGGGINADIAPVQIYQSKISGNSANESGGGIRFVGSAMTISDSLITDNTALWHGGGIDLWSASLDLQRSNVLGNSAIKGGGLSAQYSDEILIASSLLSGNQSDSLGGAVYVFAVQQLDIQNTTISGNRSLNNGAGAAFIVAPATIRHTTITDNKGKYGGAVAGAGKRVLSHSIVAGNHFEIADGSEDISGPYESNFSLIGTGAEFLGPLADYGGPTLTHALLPGSPAINAGDPAAIGLPDFDQRGEPFTRVFGGRIDIGAFEAQSLIVDTLVDENDGDYSAGDFSLREAIGLANRIAGANTIEFSPLLAGGTILMTMGEYAITDTVEIVGLGAEQLTIDAQQQSRIFNVAATTGDFTFSGMTLTRGSASEAGTAFAGGAIRSASSGLVSIHGMRFEGNRTLGNDAGGGAVYAAGAMDVEGTVFLENTTTGSNAVGGAIYAVGDVTISGSNLNANQTFGLNAGGGGIFALRTLTTDATGFINNRTNGSNSLGGGINASILAMASSTVSGNSTNGPNAPGGGISAGGRRGGGSPSSIFDSIILENYTVGSNSRGGGISAGTITIERSTISGNFTVGGNADGGGLFATTGILRDSAFVGNHTYGAGSDGGGAAGQELRPDWQITDSSFVANVTLGNNSHGGALYLRAGVSVTASNFRNNSASAGGGSIFVAGFARPNISISSSSFTGNSASFGGAIASQGNTTIVDSVLSGNRAIIFIGGSRGGGGAVFQDSPGYLSISRSIVTENLARGSDYAAGGGIKALGQTTIVQCEISNNRIIGQGFGGGMYIGGPATITDSTISGNQIIGSGRGGGVFALGSGQPISVLNSTISGNRITGEQASGAGIYAFRGIKMQHSTVTNNRIDSPTGETGGLWFRLGGLNSSPSMISHSIVAGNFVGSSASDLRSRPQLSHSFVGTNADTGLAEAPIGSPDAQGNLIGGPLHGVIDPLLAPLADNGGTTMTHALRPGSPAINAGDPALEAGVQGTPLFDQRGAPFARVAGGRIDIGAYESQPEGGLYSGDFDGDGDVDGRDFLAWQRGYGFQSAPPDRTTGDATADGNVDGLDLIVWQEMYGTTSADLGLRIADSEESSTQRMASSVKGSLAVSPRNAASRDEPSIEEPYVEPVDRALEHWAPLKRSSIDFGDIVTCRPVKRRA